MQRDMAYLREIQESARLALSYLADSDLDAFADDTQLQDAVIRRLEVIGEAARRVSEETRTAHPQLPWRQIIGMRNQMIHVYDGVDLHVVWNTVREDLPTLMEMLGEIVGGETE